jgi:hypothetical protein
MLGCKMRVSCKNLFRKLEILPLASQYILSLMLFVIKSKNEFVVNSEIHSINTRHYNLHQPISKLTKYQKVIYYSGLKVYNNLPPHIKDTSDDLKKFEAQLKQFLHVHSFCSLQEHFHYKSFSRH